MRSERAPHVMSGGRELQEEGRACAKVLRWECSHGPGNRETSVAGAQWPKWGQRSLTQLSSGLMAVWETDHKMIWLVGKALA